MAAFSHDFFCFPSFKNHEMNRALPLKSSLQPFLPSSRAKESAKKQAFAYILVMIRTTTELPQGCVDEVDSV